MGTGTVMCIIGFIGMILSKYWIKHPKSFIQYILGILAFVFCAIFLAAGMYSFITV